MDGLILVDKPAGATSHDIVARIRRILGIKRVGHFGTLDPLATGLLLVAVGTATKLFPFFSKKDKVYSGQIRLGFATDTYDALGSPASELSSNYPEREVLARTMNLFVGNLEQTPPPYSAKKLQGRPLYKWARAEKVVLLRPSPVLVHSFELKAYHPPWLDFESSCSSGTYMRSLAHDLGERLGCGAHLTRLRRLAVGDYSLSDSHSLENVERLARAGRKKEFLLPLEALLREFPRAILRESAALELQKGRGLRVEGILSVSGPGPGLISSEKEAEGTFRLFSPEGKFLALARKEQGGERLIPFLVLR
jgi:tRNA pseudouridine55 synthase